MSLMTVAHWGRMEIALHASGFDVFLQKMLVNTHQSLTDCTVVTEGLDQTQKTHFASR